MMPMVEEETNLHRFTIQKVMFQTFTIKIRQIHTRIFTQMKGISKEHRFRNLVPLKVQNGLLDFTNLLALTSAEHLNDIDH